MDLIFLARCHNLAKLLGPGFERFVKNSSLPFKRSQADDRLHDEENRFLDALHLSLIGGNFTLLTQAEFKESEGEFSTEVKVAMDTSHLSSDLFERFLERNDAVHAADISNHILVYHRGVGQATIEGLFVLRKLDIVVSILVKFILHKLSSLFKGVCRFLPIFR